MSATDEKAKLAACIDNCFTIPYPIDRTVYRSGGIMSPEGKISTTRSKILDVSTSLFASKGFDATGIDEIARAVGITKSVIYYHFKNKSEILDTIIKEFIEESMELKRTRATAFLNDPEHRVEPLIDIIISFCTSRKELLRILMMESIKGNTRSPLFELWDANVETGEELMKLATDSKERAFGEERLLEFYFMVFLPIVSFFVNVDDWSRHYRIDTSKSIDMFRRILDSYYRQVILPRFLPK
jgi:AcrR family transcriptional regulator